jgi:hypothetical protein
MNAVELFRQKLESASSEEKAALLPQIGDRYSSGEFSLGELRPLIESYLDDGNEYLRQTALEVLGFDFLETTRIDRVIEILRNDKDSGIRGAAAILLGANYQGSRNQKVLGILTTCARKDVDLSVRTWCVKAALEVTGQLDTTNITYMTQEQIDKYLAELPAPTSQ